MKRFTFAVTLIIGMSALLPSSIPLQVSAAVFTDVTSSTQYKTAIETLQSRGVLGGYSDGSFRAKSTINRAEFLKIVLEARGKDTVKDTEVCFSDVTNQWFARYVCTAKEEGIVAGYPDKTFKPEQAITFVEAAKIIALAYKQDVQDGGMDWFQAYVKALEASKAIPTSIMKFDQPLVRGEMAEMMWRLSDNRTDQPSKGFLNVKYPEVRVNLASDKVQLATSCADLRALATESQQGNMYGRGMLMEDGAMPMAPMMNQAGAPANSKAEFSGTGGSGGADYSKTNVQVEGVDEGDIVKTDGTHLFIASNQKVRIVKATPANGMKQLSLLDFSDNNLNISDLYLVGKNLIVIGNTWSAQPYAEKRASGMSTGVVTPWRASQRFDVRTYDVSNPESPKLTRTLDFEGSPVSSRLIGNRLYLVLQQAMAWNYPTPLRDIPDDKLLPAFEDSATGKTAPVARCGDVAILPRVPSPQYLTVAVIPTDNPKGVVETEVVLGSGDNIYASLNNLYVAVTEWNYRWDANASRSTQNTTIYRFAFTNDGVDLQAQGTVPGRILNQFSMDEHEEHFRIATTLDSMWDSNQKSSNNLFILNKAMEKVSSIEDIAPGESIYSVRFMGDRAYMVTFQKIDPFFVIDASNPHAPKILGKLKIPGYSDYLHPYDDTHIIGVGKETVEAKEGNFAWYQGMKLALFDVTDVANPKELHKVTIGDRGTESPLLHNHKALLFDKERNLLAFPVTVHKIADNQKIPGSEASAYGSPVFQGAYMYELTLAKGFALKGTVTHYDGDEMMKSGDYWYPQGKDVERIVRINNSLYTISQAGVQSHSWPAVSKEGEVSFLNRTSDDVACPSEAKGAVYQSRNPDTCALMRFMCIATMKAFSNSCGCGCEPL